MLLGTNQGERRETLKTEHFEMELDNRLKKELSEATVKALLEDAKFRVMPFGVESQLRDVACLSKQEYFEANIPKAMRLAPDFIVIPPEEFKPKFVEVKYRTNWSDKVFADVARQVELYKEILLICVVPRKELGNIDDHIRGVEISKRQSSFRLQFPWGALSEGCISEKILANLRWEDLKTLDVLFNAQGLATWPAEKTGVLSGLLTK